MDSIFTYFLLFLAGVTALITYLILPRLPVIALASAAAVALVAGVWWHWNHFSTEYRLSTWQEGLRNYASYAMVFLVILMSYGVYAFAKGGSGPGSLQATAVNAQTNMANAVNAVAEILPAPLNFTVPTPAANVGANANKKNNSRNNTGGLLGLNLGLGGEEISVSSANNTKKNNSSSGNFLI
jgi:hypothetical protein